MSWVGYLNKRQWDREPRSATDTSPFSSGEERLSYKQRVGSSNLSAGTLDVKSGNHADHKA